MRFTIKSDYAKLLNLDEMPEADAIDLYHALADHFGWAGTFFTRDDAEQEWQIQTRSDENGDEPNTDPMPDEVWERIQQTWEWRKMNGPMCEYGWDWVTQAVQMALTSEGDAR